MEGKMERETDLSLMSWDDLSATAEYLRVLAHPVRLRVVDILLKGRFTVGEIAEMCDVPSNVASEHLRLLQRCGLLESDRDGRRIFYRVAEGHLNEMMSCIKSRVRNAV